MMAKSCLSKPIALAAVSTWFVMLAVGRQTSNSRPISKARSRSFWVGILHRIRVTVKKPRVRLIRRLSGLLPRTTLGLVQSLMRRRAHS